MRLHILMLGWTVLAFGWFYTMNSVKGQCPVNTPNFVVKQGYRLYRHVIYSLYAEKEVLCRLKCNTNDRCLTFNFEEASRICELNDADHTTAHKNDLQKTEGFIYVDVKKQKKSQVSSTKASSSITTTAVTTTTTVASTSAAHTTKTSTSTNPTTDTTTSLPTTKPETSTSAALTTKTSTSTTPITEATTSPPTTPMTVPACPSYTEIKDETRHVNYRNVEKRCDRAMSVQWYRFTGAAGTRMPTSCVHVQNGHCDTNAQGWLKGAHPTVQEGIVSRTVCFSYTDCCQWSTTIRVLNCGGFYVYELQPTPNCHLRYCGTN